MATTADMRSSDATPDCAAGPSSAGNSGARSPTIEHPLDASHSSPASDTNEVDVDASSQDPTSQPTPSASESALEPLQRVSTSTPAATSTALPASDSRPRAPTPSPPPQPHSPGQIQPVRPAAPANEEAVQVRGHLIRGLWHNFRSLGRGRRWMFMLRLFISLAQLVPGIVVLSLPTSLGNSPGRAGSECDPEPIFVYLALHVVRVAASLPTELYLAVSPHRNTRQRRPTSAGFLERERRRQFGNLDLDRKASRISDLLGFCHVVLFAVGNYTVWSGTACAHPPADSVPLFWTSFSMLSLSYLVILNVIFLIFMIVFFLPLLIGILRALGLGHRIPQQGIRPSTGKVGKDEVDKVTKLVYYVPEEEPESATGASEAPEGGAASPPASAGGQGEPDEQSSGHEDAHKHAGTPATNAEVHAHVQEARATARQGRGGWTHILGSLLGLTRDSGHSTTSHSTGATAHTGDAGMDTSVGSETVKAGDDEDSHLNQRLGGRSSRTRRGAGQRSGSSADHAGRGSKPSDAPSARKFKYPLHPLPSHRSTCPICLCDFESPLGASNQDSEGAPAGQGSEAEPEPLRLLPCNHVLHASCVDEWLTTVSGRCPVCQRPILKGKDDVEGAGEGEREGAAAQGQGAAAAEGAHRV